MPCFTWGNHLLTMHVFVLVSQIKAVWLSTWNWCEIPTSLLHVEIVCWQRVISGECSDLHHRKASQDWENKRTVFLWPLVGVWRYLLGQGLG